MTTRATADRVARLATTTGAVGIAAGACFGAFAVLGEPFGLASDVGYAVLGGLAGALAWRLRSAGRTPAWASAAAVAGAAVTVAGSSLVISGATGWLLAGFVSAVGFGLIGPSVAIAGSNLDRGGLVSPRLGWLGRATGAVMTVGLTAIVPVAMRVDDAATAPGWTWLTMAGWMGAIILYPAWCLWLGRASAPRREVSTARM